MIEILDFSLRACNIWSLFSAWTILYTLSSSSRFSSISAFVVLPNIFALVIMSLLRLPNPSFLCSSVWTKFISISFFPSWVIQGCFRISGSKMRFSGSLSRIDFKRSLTYWFLIRSKLICSSTIKFLKWNWFLALSYGYYPHNMKYKVMPRAHKSVFCPLTFLPSYELVNISGAKNI